MVHAIEVEIDRNYAAFRDMLDTLLLKDEGKYALLRNQELLGVYASPAEADRAGLSMFEDEMYSIQLVTKQPVDLGFYSYGYVDG